MGSCINLRNNLWGRIEWGPGGYLIEDDDDEGEEQEEEDFDILLFPFTIAFVSNIYKYKKERRRKANKIARITEHFYIGEVNPPGP